MDNVTLTLVLIVVAIVAAILLIRFVMAKIIDKGTDAIRNKLVDKENSKASHESSNLADRHKDE